MHVTIVGAGLAGLTLARVLHLREVNFTLYEAAEPDAVSDDGWLDLRGEGVDAAIAATELSAEFSSILELGREATRIVDYDGTILFDVPDDGVGAVPQVSRQALRRMLLASIPPSSIRFGEKVSQARPLGRGRHELSFESGAVATSEFLVGADGRDSHVRNLVTDVKPAFAGHASFEARLLDIDRKHPDTATLVGDGTLMAFDSRRGGTVFLIHKDPDGSARGNLWLARPQDWFAHVDTDDQGDLRARLLLALAGWAPELIRMINESDLPIAFYLHEALPSDHSWESVRGVTLIGDAAHLQPRNVKGAVLALMDGAQLGERISAGLADFDEAIAEFEKSMFSRSGQVATDAAAMLSVTLGRNAASKMIAEAERYSA